MRLAQRILSTIDGSVEGCFMLNLLKSLSIVGLSLLVWSSSSFGAVWEVTNQWDASWEARYQDWVAREWDSDFFLKQNPMQGSVVDCADVVYTMRAYFAATNGLPFAIKDPTTRASDKIISHEMNRWDSKPQDVRIRSFIKLLYSVGSTATLPNDSYPTAIGRTTLHSGSFILSDRANHHSWTIRSFTRTGIPHLLFGSRPARSKLYERKDYPSTSFVFPKGIRPETNAGFRNFRYIGDLGKPVHEVPGYSLEQYSLPARNYMRQVQKLMQEIEETHEQRVSRLLTDSCKGMEERVEIIEAGVRKNAELGSQCMNATEYDDHSTPSRDSRLKSAFEDLASSFQEGSNERGLSRQLQAQVKAVVNGRGSNNSDMPCSVTLSNGKSLSLGEVYKLSISDKLSNNPHDTLEMRWGLQRGPSAKAKSCPVY